MHPATTTAAIRASLISIPIMVPITAMITETRMIAPMTSRMTRNMRSLYGGSGTLTTGLAGHETLRDLLVTIVVPPGHRIPVMQVNLPGRDDGVMDQAPARCMSRALGLDLLEIEAPMTCPDYDTWQATP
jgi:hypothetical protein